MTRDEARALKPGDMIVVTRKNSWGSPHDTTVGREYVVEKGTAIDGLMFRDDAGERRAIEAWHSQIERAPTPSSDFDPAWPHGHVTRDGRKARVICTDAVGPLPVVALVPDSSGDEVIVRYYSNGALSRGGNESIYDLINAPAPRPEPIVERRWATANRDGRLSYTTYELKAQAVEMASKLPAFRAVPVEIRELRDNE